MMDKKIIGLYLIKTVAQQKLIILCKRKGLYIMQKKNYYKLEQQYQIFVIHLQVNKKEFKFKRLSSQDKNYPSITWNQIQISIRIKKLITVYQLLFVQIFISF
ncbi:unnamed protein product [Paramecium sonneborni]|uniref:Uncharacterized protein n=1 Tax=Paramecium sonneborni TaxID=65129 RepID=A0A8S1QU28_9CILI|nr:unnamed protein product [Paramecium sonneborni]